MSATPLVHAVAIDRPALIEASAGTGKTWTIAGLYVRLLLAGANEIPAGAGNLAPYTPADILVVTFTRPATAELRDRIRSRVVEVLDAITALEARHVGAAPGWTVDGADLTDAERNDEFLAHLLVGKDATWCAEASRRLQLAARSMDTSAIYTIHGFCERVLGEFSFETQTPLGAELITDEAEQVGEVLADFWRRNVANAGYGLAQLLVENGITPERWRDDLEGLFDRVGALPAGTNPPSTSEQALAGIDLAARWQRLASAHRAARDAWHRAEPCGGEAAERPEQEFERLLATALKKTKYHPSTYPKVLFEIDAHLASPEPVVSAFEHEDKLSLYCHPGFVLNAGKEPLAPRHSFFRVFGEYVAAHEDARQAITEAIQCYRLAAFLYVREELPKRKAARELQSYGDLLTRVADALDATRHGHAADVLAEQLRRRYRVALIDEFQDTDPLQYRIFRALFHPGANDGVPVFLVGDPKQAIYGFRGADINAYLDAASALRGTAPPLTVNRRSDEGYLLALNALFGRSPSPFLEPQIPYLAAEAVPGKRRALPDDRKPLQFLVLPENTRKPGAPFNREIARRLSAEATAAEIAALLRAGEGRSEQPVREGDIAVLVYTNRQAARVGKALSDLGIRYVLRGRESVFATEEAEQVERLMAAMLAPSDDRALRAAMVGIAMGRSATDLLRLDSESAVRDALVDAVAGWRGLWNTQGFMPMFRAWLRDEDVARRLLAQQQGERRLTNLMQLAELLHTRAAQQGAGPEALLEYLRAERQGGETPPDEQLLRLESDAHRVRIVTIHAAKGLEYPIVFCPFLWDGAKDGKDAQEVVVVHRDGRVEIDFATAATATTRAENRERARREDLQEKLRLLYVALTRARHRCYVVWGQASGVETSAMGWLLYGLAPDAVLEEGRVPAIAAPGSRDAMLGILGEVASGCDAIGVVDAPMRWSGPLVASTDDATEPLPLHFSGSLDVAWRTTSFSRLTKGVHAEAPDHDADAAERPAPAPAPPGRNRFSFPRGASAGTVLHSLFEDCDFADAAAGSPGTDQLVLEALKALEGEWPNAGDTPSDWLPAARELLRDVLTTTLPGAECTLASLRPGQIAREMGFTYSLGALNAQVLAGLIDRHHPSRAAFAEAARRFDRSAMAGYMRGFIDLVFEAGGRYYVLDYKSNHLGNTPEDYEPAPMERAIADAHYYLQYLVYVVALHRHLTFVLGGAYDPVRHLGGVHYLFLRGVGTGPGRGIFFDQPPPALIEALDVHIGTKPGGDR